MRCYLAEVGEDAKLERADLFFGVPQRLHIIVGRSAAWRHTLAATRREPFFFRSDFSDQRFDRSIVRVDISGGGSIVQADIGRGSQQPFYHDRPCFGGSERRIIDGSRETDQCAGQFIL